MSAETPTASPAGRASADSKASAAVLVVGEARALRPAYEEALKGTGAKVVWVSDVGEALAEVCKAMPLAVLTEVHLPGLPATSLVAALKASARHRAVPIGVVTPDLGAAREILGAHRPDRMVEKNTDLVKNLQRFFEATGIVEGSGKKKQVASFLAR